MTAIAKLQCLNHTGPTVLSSATNHTVDASNEGIAWVTQAGTTNAITKMGFRYGARTGTPPTYIASLQSLNASTGAPSGTVLGGGSPASQTFTPPADTSWDGEYKEITFANSYTPASREEVIALVIEYSSGTIDGSNCSSFTRGMGGISGNSGLPYHLTNTSGTWTKLQTAPVFSLYTASEVIGAPVKGKWTGAVSGAAGRRIGMYFTLPSGLATSYVLRGFQARVDIGTSGQTVIAGVWDSGGTQQAITGAMDTDLFSEQVTESLVKILFASPPTLSFGTKYYVGLESGGTSAINLIGIQLGSAADRAAYPLGTSRGGVSYNGSTWTEDDTVVPGLDLIIEDVTAPSGSGSAIVIGG